MITRRLTPGELQGVAFPMSADAQAYSSRVTEKARLRSEEIMREAQEHSDLLMEEARARAREAAVSALNVTPPGSEPGPGIGLTPGGSRRIDGQAPGQRHAPAPLTSGT